MQFILKVVKYIQGGFVVILDGFIVVLKILFQKNNLQVNIYFKCYNK